MSETFWPSHSSRGTCVLLTWNPKSVRSWSSIIITVLRSNSHPHDGASPSLHQVRRDASGATAGLPHRRRSYPSPARTARAPPRVRREAEVRESSIGSSCLQQWQKRATTTTLRRGIKLEDENVCSHIHNPPPLPFSTPCLKPRGSLRRVSAAGPNTCGHSRAHVLRSLTTHRLMNDARFVRDNRIPTPASAGMQPHASPRLQRVYP